MTCKELVRLLTREFFGALEKPKLPVISNLFCWDDPAAWAPMLIDRGTPQTNDAVLCALFESFSGLKVYHGCRPLDVSTYLTDGIQPLGSQDLNEEARRLAHEFYPGVLDGDIHQAITDVPVAVEGNVYACVDRRQLHSGVHFLRYGSERVYLILKRLGELSAQDYLPQLGARGRPVIFELAIPWRDVGDWLQKELANAISQCVEEVKVGRPIAVRDWVYAQDRKFHQSAIIAHYEAP